MGPISGHASGRCHGSNFQVHDGPRGWERPTMYGVSLCTVQETPAFATSKPVVVTVTTALVVELGVLKLNSEKKWSRGRISMRYPMRVEDSFGRKHFSKSAAQQGDDNSGYVFVFNMFFRNVRLKKKGWVLDFCCEVGFGLECVVVLFLFFSQPADWKLLVVSKKLDDEANLYKKPRSLNQQVFIKDFGNHMSVNRPFVWFIPKGLLLRGAGASWGCCGTWCFAQVAGLAECRRGGWRWDRGGGCPMEGCFYALNFAAHTWRIIPFRIRGS